ncbi:immunoglobulin domain-containing family protein [Halobacterium jilantaiense]|uniref:Lipoprotein n=1 Tax=Halobacterium jilantaiense TaxID=355548 RepID=A0A1I0P649_9EURY|nr:hypothetical protein [Halobacterium jilantaiense]SEW09742.1 hypothetical protein SAMN04487945_1424 [Halobacterium jilantaiense]
MRRRTMLAAVASGAVTATAGCARLPAWSDDGTADGAGVSESSFTVGDANCGEGSDSATVRTEDAAVAVRGTVTVASGCQTVELDDATVDDGELRVVVASVEREGVEQCVQCLTDVSYSASVTPVGGLPERVVVVHEARGERNEVASVDL